MLENSGPENLKTDKMFSVHTETSASDPEMALMHAHVTVVLFLFCPSTLMRFQIYPLWIKHFKNTVSVWTAGQTGLKKVSFSNLSGLLQAGPKRKGGVKRRVKGDRVLVELRERS